MKSSKIWYVRNVAGKVFGPIPFETLKEWVKDGRIEPLASISQNLSTWMLASLNPELEMDWIIENNPGQFYGPTHRAVVDDFLKTGSLAPEARFYQSSACVEAKMKPLKDDNAALAADKKALEGKVADLAAGMQKCQDEVAAIRDRLAKTESKLIDETARAEEALAAKDHEIAELKEQLRRQSEVHVPEWRTEEPLVPEVVVSDEPPPQVARNAFGGANQATLAAIERQAQAELARMGASGAKKFFTFGKKK